MATIQQHHIKALTPTWFLAKITPPPATREGANKKATAHSPLLLLPAASQEPQDAKITSKDGGGERMPASPRISCMGHVKGKTRGCASARGPAPPTTRGHHGAGGGGKVLATFVLGLFGRRNARTTSRACAKVRDVPAGSSRGARHGGGAAATVTVLMLDPPLPVVRRPAADTNAPNLWERRRGAKALQGLQLTQIA
ncbi:hypothetical protein HU200_045366 [Digitaria exilis]|uniref:Uncharacterized protein n=1 Tax=Digitaria exilis TaxID=1010633 RepID=A0A835B0B1_9POAL|nr:hypothetical protein HU200_045366 [Digitaria exilis]